MFYLEKGADGRVYSKWDPYYVKSLSRFMNAGVIPHLSPQRMYCFGLLPSIQRKVLGAPTYSSGPGVLLQFLFALPNPLNVLQIQVFQSNNANLEILEVEAAEVLEETCVRRPLILISLISRVVHL